VIAGASPTITRLHLDKIFEAFSLKIIKPLLVPNYQATLNIKDLSSISFSNGECYCRKPVVIGIISSWMLISKCLVTSGAGQQQKFGWNMVQDILSNAENQSCIKEMIQEQLITVVAETSDDKLAEGIPLDFLMMLFNKVNSQTLQSFLF
jgi:hypothetical protein